MVRVTTSNSPLKIAVKQGFIKSPGEVIIGIPDRLVVKVVGDSEDDSELDFVAKINWEVKKLNEFKKYNENYRIILIFVILQSYFTNPESFSTIIGRWTGYFMTLIMAIFIAIL